MISIIIRFGKEYYQINNTGKLYPSMKKAEKQLRKMKRNGS